MNNFIFFALQPPPTSLWLDMPAFCLTDRELKIIKLDVSILDYFGYVRAVLITFAELLCAKINLFVFLNSVSNSLVHHTIPTEYQLRRKCFTTNSPQC